MNLLGNLLGKSKVQPQSNESNEDIPIDSIPKQKPKTPKENLEQKIYKAYLRSEERRKLLKKGGRKSRKSRKGGRKSRRK